MKDDKGKVIFADSICYHMYWDKLASKTLGISISFIIVGMNLILRYTIVYLIEYIGDD